MKKRGMELTGNEVKPRWELDYDLLPNEGLFGEYLEMGMSPGRFPVFVREELISENQNHYLITPQ